MPDHSGGGRTYRPKQNKLVREVRRRRGERAVKLTVDNVCAAIKQHRGVLNEIAMAFAITRSHIDKFIVSCPRALETLKDAREALGDVAEQKLYDLIEAGDRHAIIYYLSTKCRNRGYALPSRGEDRGESASKQVFVHTINIISSDSGAGETYTASPPMIEHERGDANGYANGDANGHAQPGAGGAECVVERVGAENGSVDAAAIEGGQSAGIEEECDLFS